MIILAVWASLAPAAPAARPAPQPAIHRRSEWCPEKLGDIPVDMPKQRIVVHHTAFPVTDKVKRLRGKKSWQAAIAHARQVQHLHRHIRGWQYAGYHYMIDWEGRIFEGRPLDRLGAHVENNNTGSIGVVLMGDFSKQTPTKKQLASLKGLLAWLRRFFDIPADKVHGHYRMKHTVCPGLYLDNVWDPDAPALNSVQISPPSGE
ncbi:MAG: N-acetylmuramoyl-L-alanine amidase [Elusimicrobia bacterium]|nr:N-acetylmuramoyl-L-alanine amidase [Elusimicrobiota bacterium]